MTSKSTTRKKPGPATQPVPSAAVVVAKGRLSKQMLREVWDSLALGPRLRVTIVAVVAATSLIVQFAVGVYDVAANFRQSYLHVKRVSAAIIEQDARLGSSAVLYAVQSQPTVIAATLQSPTGTVLWSFDRNAPTPEEVVSFDHAKALTESWLPWYEEHRLEDEPPLRLNFVARPVPLAAGAPARLELFIATPSSSAIALHHLLQLPFILAFGLALALLAARRLNGQVVQPLAQLAEATRIEGLIEQAPAKTGRADNELTRLAENFHALTHRLAENERDMRNVRLASRQQILERTQEIEARLERAESMMRSKDQFLANMSHEVRTPLNGVLGMAELLADTSLDKRQRRFVESMREAANTMMQIINDILDDSKIEAGKMDLVCEPFEVRDLVEQAAQLFAGRAETKKIELSCQVEPGVPAVVIGDALRLRQVLGNLLSNAVKYTDHGEIQVRVGVDDLGQASRCRLYFRVSDTGPGIAPKHQAEVFEAFTQLENASRVGGTGLGLSIATGLVQLMGGGRIDLHSQPGHGSAFSFALPFEIAESAAVQDSTEFKGMRALIVDDMATSYMSLQEMLASWGVEVTVATSGHAIDDQVSSAARLGHPFDVVLLDHALPDATAEDLLRAIRLDSTVPDTYIALMSAFEFEPRQAGKPAVRPDVCIAKPLRQKQLRTLLRTVRAARDGTDVDPSDTPTEPASQRQSGLGLNVLVADDNMINRSVASAMLEQLSCSVVIAEDGRAAVELWRAGTFDVLLMDCQMPIMDGYAATMEIRREESAGGMARTSIVALTANALTRDKGRCLAAGMDAFLAKPFTQAQLATMLHPIAAERGTLLPPKPIAAPAERASPQPRTRAVTPGPAPGQVLTQDEADLTGTDTITLLDSALFADVVGPSAPVLDAEQVNAIRGLGRANIFERLCDMLYASAPDALRRITTALEAGNLEAAAGAAHSLKSAVSNLGGRQLAEQLDAFETSILDHGDLQTARRAAVGLPAAYAQLTAALQAQAARRTGS